MSELIEIKMKKIIISLISSLIILSVCSKEAIEKEEDKIFVSILPQKYFVERIAGDKFEVQVMVQPGHNPATYEPTPKQMVALSQTKMYFRIGVPFEKSWLPKIQEANPEMKIVDTRKGIELREMEAAKDLLIRFGVEKVLMEKKKERDPHYEHDPHIWLSPSLVKIQARNIYDALVNSSPREKEFYQKKLNAFQQDLDKVHNEIAETFSKIGKKEFLVFHPAWGYFADEFGLTQIPIEIQGRTPNPKELSVLLSFANYKKIRVIFIQQQFSSREAEVVTDAIKGKVIKIDPLAEDYLENLRVITKNLMEGMGEE